MLSRAGSAGTVPYRPDYREALVAPNRPLILDPLLAGGDPASRDVAALTSRALLRIDSRAQAVPDLAAAWGISGDGRAYRFTLAAGLRWSDGSALTADDVRASIAAVQAPGFPDTSMVASWRNVNVGIEGTDVIVLTLPAPHASFAAVVANLPIVPTTVASKPTAALIATASRAVPASGPFRVGSADGTLVRLEPNPRATLAPHLRGIELHLYDTFDAALAALGAAQVDALEAVTPAEREKIRHLHGLRLHDAVSFRFVDLLLNARRPPLGDPAVRRALASAIDRAAIIARALDGAARPQVDAIPVGIAWVGAGSPELPDPALAARALDAAGWQRAGPSGVRTRAGLPLALVLSVPDAPPLPAVADVVAEQLGAVGVRVELRTVPAERFAPDVLSKGVFDLAIADWDSGPDPDISSFWRSNATPPVGFNVSGLPADPFLDRALDSLATESDAQLRIGAAQQVDQRLADDLPAVLLYAPVTTFAVSEALENVNVPAVGPPPARYLSVDTWARRPG